MNRPTTYSLEDFYHKPLHKSCPKALKASKYLDPSFNLVKLGVNNNILKRVLKKSSAKKVAQMEIQPTVLPYYAPMLRSSLKKLVLTRYSAQKVMKNSGVKSIRVAKNTFDSCKYLEDLVVPDVFLWPYLTLAKKLRNLRCIEFTIMDTQIPNIYNLFTNITALQSVKVKIIKGSSAHKLDNAKQIAMAWRFLRDLFGLKQLKALKMNIEEGCLVNQDYDGFFSKICQLIGGRTNSIEDLDLFLGLETPGDDDFIENLEARRFLSEVEELNFRVGNVDESSSKKFYKKRVNLYFPKTKQTDVSNIISKCLSLKRLSIQSENDRIIFGDNLFISRGLKIIDLDLNKSSNEKIPQTLFALAGGLCNCQLISFNLSLDKIEETTLNELVQIHQTFSPYLEEYHLKTSNPYTNRKIVSALDQNMLNTLVQSLQNSRCIKHLELQLNLETSNSIHNIQNLVETLSGLIHLDLNVYSVNSKASSCQQEKSYFELYQGVLSRLEHLRVKLDDVFVLGDLKGFFSIVSESENLKKLIVDCEALNEANLDDRESIAQNLAKLLKLESLLLGSKSKQIQSQIELIKSSRNEVVLSRNLIEI